LTIDTRIVVYGFDLLGIGDLIDIENTRDVVPLQLILLTAPRRFGTLRASGVLGLERETSRRLRAVGDTSRDFTRVTKTIAGQKSACGKFGYRLRVDHPHNPFARRQLAQRSGIGSSRV
jgi:hypothetical protein